MLGVGPGGGVLVGGIPGMPGAMVQGVPGMPQHQLGLIGMPRFRWPLPASTADLGAASASHHQPDSSHQAASIQLQLAARAAAAQQAAHAVTAAGQPGPGQTGQLSGQAAANLLAHPLLGAASGGGGAGVILLPRLP